VSAIHTHSVSKVIKHRMFSYRKCGTIKTTMTWTLISQGLPPTKFGRVKNVQNSALFLTTFEFDRKYLMNGSSCRKYEEYLINYILSRIGRKNGELWSTNNKVIDAHVDPPNWTFSGDYISAPEGRLPLKFLHARDIGPGLLTHTEYRVGGPAQKFKGEHLKLGLKFHICAPITLGLVRITSRNFTRGCASFCKMHSIQLVMLVLTRYYSTPQATR